MQLPSLANSARAEVDTLLRQAVESRELPFVVGMVANRDEVLYEGSFGAAMSDLYRIASLTKAITSVAIMMLAERGVLGLDDPLERYLPEYGGREVIDSFNGEDGSYTTRPARRTITLRHLLTHTAGFGYFTGLGFDFMREEMQILSKEGKQRPREAPLLFDPGSRWIYGCGTAILGDVITAVTSAPFYEFFDREILAPLGMAETSYFLEPDRLPRLRPLTIREGRSWIKDANPGPHQPYVSGEGGLVAPAGDFMRFAQMLLNEGQAGETRLLSAESVREMSRNQIGELTVGTMKEAVPGVMRAFPSDGKVDKFGLGFQIKESSQPNLRSAGDRWVGIFNTHFWVDPQKGITALFFTHLMPFYDEQFMRLLADFEECVYKVVNNSAPETS